MRTLERDRQPFTYCKYLGKEAIVNDDGFKTGEYKLKYDTPKVMRAGISEGSGQTYISQYGLNLNYARTIRTADKTNILPEGTILFIDIPVTFENDVPKGDYVIVKIIQSINFITYGVERIE